MMVIVVAVVVDGSVGACGCSGCNGGGDVNEDDLVVAEKWSECVQSYLQPSLHLEPLP